MLQQNTMVQDKTDPKAAHSSCHVLVVRLGEQAGGWQLDGMQGVVLTMLASVSKVMACDLMACKLLSLPCQAWVSKVMVCKLMACKVLLLTMSLS